MNNIPQQANVVIIGAGIMGASIAYELAKRNVKQIIVLEKNAIGSGATGRSSGVLRCHYSIPVLARMAVQSLEIYQHAEEILGEDVGYSPIGYLVGLGEENLPILRENIRMLRQIGVDTEFLTADDVKKRWPAIDTDQYAGFAFEPKGGYGDPFLTNQAYAKKARELGVTIKQQCAVKRLLTSNDDSFVVGVETDKYGTIHADCVIVASGIGSNRLMETAGVDVPIKGQRAQLLNVDPASDAMKSFPVFGDLVNFQYIKPEKSGNLLVGNADHTNPEFIAANDYDSGNFPKYAEETYIEKAAMKFLHCFPDLAKTKLVSAYSGIYEVTPDFNPIISKTPIDGVYVCAGFSGHGFKIAPAVGRLMSDLVMVGDSQQPDIDLAPFRLSRFEEKDFLVAANPYKTKTTGHV